MTGERPVLSVQGLRAVAGSGRTAVPLIRGVSFDLAAGEAVALVGESGSGKSMTALSVMGLLPPGVRTTEGSVVVGGRDLATLDARERRTVRGAEVAMIYQDPMTSLNPLMRVGAQVVEGLVAHGVSGDEARQRAVAALGEVGLPRPERTGRAYPHELSGGQRQRVMIAMAMALRPKVLIADEPTTALDVTIQQQVLALADELRRSTGMALLWITHDVGVVARLAERVLVMYAGRVVEAGPTRGLFETPQHPYTAGLLGSLPPMLGDERPDLPQIGGRPPELSALPEGCAFHPRCRQREDRCLSDDPGLEARGPAGAAAACWVPRERWVP
ncbi:ABC transporter ATP-binding protein [Nocardioides sp. GXQ0305]|uniref:ABC transporter ATP-binding protein n=1 Tax=Nocardioides sp. GXQ0305 TaxID=3423912 RepID=UPI003D7E9768